MTERTFEPAIGLRVVPVAANRVKVLNDAGTMMLDIYDLPANLGMEVSAYLVGESKPRCTADISTDGDIIVREAIDLLLEGAMTETSDNKKV